MHLNVTIEESWTSTDFYISVETINTKIHTEE